MLLVKKNYLYTLTVFISVNIFTSMAYSKAPEGKSLIAFFKSKNSQFPSGESPLNRLNQKLFSRAQETVKIEKNYYQFGHQKIATSLIQPTFASELSLRPGYADIGVFMTLSESYLKEKPDSRATSLIKINIYSKLIPLKFENGFVQVMHQGQKGYVDISNCISKFDYAYAVYATHPKTLAKQWHYVKSRIFDQIETYDGSHISMSRIEGIFTNDKMGIITGKNSDLPIWSRVTLKNQLEENTTEVAEWNQSFLQGHGLVWWKIPNYGSKKTLQDVLKIDDILKKDVYSISSHPKEPKKSIISVSDGVYITSDGLNWKSIETFKNYRGPVYYYNDNLIFVGSYRSTNQAKTFEPYINIQSLSSVIKNKIGYNPQSLKIKKIKSTTPSQIILDVDTGFRTLQLQSMIYNQNWEVVKH